MKKCYEEIVEEQNNWSHERDGLKQQCNTVIRQWDLTIRERNEYKETLAKVQHQYEETMKEINKLTVVRVKAKKEITRLTEERNATLQEYSLIMGERDTVHKEMEKLGDDLSQAYTKITHLENQNKQLVEEVVEALLLQSNIRLVDWKVLSVILVFQKRKKSYILSSFPMVFYGETP